MFKQDARARFRRLRPHERGRHLPHVADRREQRSRLVVEDRGLIGTYLGLGYGRVTITLRYALFALLACLIGGGLGLLIGFLGIPAFLLVVIRGLYAIPDLTLEYDWIYGRSGTRCQAIGSS